MKNKKYWINWVKAAGIRAVKTLAQTTAVLSILTSVAGLPEIPKWEEVDEEINT